MEENDDIAYATPREGVSLACDETIFLPEAVRRRSEAIRDLGPHNALYIAAWDQVKAASGG
ncbi:MAG: hypothetical protein GX590_07835 [Lentisphaerae bacterium]|jgi:hypothetical protein|nr:hypothetical protein [Lentisphaerota bacterium]